MGRAFKEQIIWLTRAWDDWSEAEQVVALYSVARKLSPIPTRFLQVLLTYNYPQDGASILAFETRANDPAWVSRVCESEDNGASDLLQHLPLLRPTNAEAKAHYLSAIPKVLANALTQGSNQPILLEKARQLLSYTLIHPAITPEERKKLALWLKALEDKLSLIGIEGSEALNSCLKDDKRRSSNDNNSLTADNNNWNASLNQNNQNLTSNKEDGAKWNHLDIPASPNNSAASSRSSESESIAEENNHAALHPGMKDLGVWLKSLRLHKYYNVLSGLSYDELLRLDEHTLESKKITKGARHKIILSIAKLRERPQMLISIEKEIKSGISILSALNQLKQISMTPMLPSKAQDLSKNPEDATVLLSLTTSISIESNNVATQEFDLPTQFIRMMGKVCTQLLVSARPSDEAMSVFISIVDRCTHHEAFTHAQIKRLLSWKQQIISVWRPIPPRGKDLRHLRRWSQQLPSDPLNRASVRFQHHRYSNASPSQLAGFLSTVSLSSPLTTTIQQSGLNPTQISFSPNTLNPFYGIQGIPSQIGGPLVGPRNVLPTAVGSSLFPPQTMLSKRPSLQETPQPRVTHVTLQRTRSAPSRPYQPPQLSQLRTFGENLCPPVVTHPEYPQQEQELSSQASELIARQQDFSTRLDPVYPTAANWCLKNEPLSNTVTGENFSTGVVGGSLRSDHLGNKGVSPSAQSSLQQSCLSVSPSNDNKSREQSEESDITNRLESLCLSMTEHALG